MSFVLSVSPSLFGSVGIDGLLVCVSMVVVCVTSVLWVLSSPSVTAPRFGSVVAVSGLSVVGECFETV